MDYNEALAYINDKNKFGSRLGLASIERLLELLGRPQDGMNFIHVAGTNGKGSCSSFIGQILIEAGYQVGSFTSPYIERFNERIQKNREDIDDQSLARLTYRVKLACDQMLKEGLDHPTTFEIVTAIAFLYFKEEVDYVVLEVGLGGRYDSTNIIDRNSLAVITSISYDHVDILGSSLEEISYQKAGIIKPGSQVVSYFQEEEAGRVLLEETSKNQGDIDFLQPSDIVLTRLDESGASFDYRDLKDLRINMLGGHQVYNAALAVLAIEKLRERDQLKLSEKDIRAGLEKTSWPARLEKLRSKPDFLIDGAHNLEAVERLVEAIELFDYRRLILGIGILKDKDYGHILDRLLPMADLVVATEVNMPRKLDLDSLAEEIEKRSSLKVYKERQLDRAVKKALELADEEDLILFAGSLYLVGGIKEIIKNTPL